MHGKNNSSYRVPDPIQGGKILWTGGQFFHVIAQQCHISYRLHLNWFTLVGLLGVAWSLPNNEDLFAIRVSGIYIEYIIIYITIFVRNWIWLNKLLNFNWILLFFPRTMGFCLLYIGIGVCISPFPWYQWNPYFWRYSESKMRENNNQKHNLCERQLKKSISLICLFLHTFLVLLFSFVSS